MGMGQGYECTACAQQSQTRSRSCEEDTCIAEETLNAPSQTEATPDAPEQSLTMPRKSMLMLMLIIIIITIITGLET